MKVLTKEVTELNLFDEFGKIDNENVLFIASTGGGKSLALETTAEAFHDCGYVIIYLTDVKDKCEPCFAKFKPEERWHLERIRQDGRFFLREPQAKNVQVYHPFTFSIPTRKLPNYNLFTIPVKSMGMEELSVLAETKMESQAIKLFFDTIKELKRDEGLSDLLYYAGEKLEVKTSVKGTKMIRQPDPDNFFLKTPVSGTQKTLSELSTFFRPFFYGNHYLFAPDTCKYNLDPMKILNNQKDYHVLLTKYLVNDKYNVKDEKIADIVQLNFYKSILRNIEKAKHPVCFCIDEIRKWLPANAEGYKKYLIGSMKDDFSTTRSRGRGVTTLCGSQVYRGIAPEILGCFSSQQVYVGSTSDQKELQTMGEALRLSADKIREITNNPRNNFSMLTDNAEGGYTFLVPQHMHAEPTYNYDEMVARLYPDEMRKYDEVFADMNELHDKELGRIKERSDRAIKEMVDKVMLLEQRRKMARVERFEEKAGMDKKKSRQRTEIMKGVSIELAQKWRQLYLEEGKSYYEIARIYNMFMPNGKPYAVKIQLSIQKLNEIEQEKEN